MSGNSKSIEELWLDAVLGATALISTNEGPVLISKFGQVVRSVFNESHVVDLADLQIEVMCELADAAGMTFTSNGSFEDTVWNQIKDENFLVVAGTGELLGVQITFEALLPWDFDVAYCDVRMSEGVLCIQEFVDGHKGRRLLMHRRDKPCPHDESAIVGSWFSASGSKARLYRFDDLDDAFVPSTIKMV